MSSVTGPLEGIRILDLTRILAGPTCTQLLGDLGADIIKVEKPVDGDDTRGWGPPYLKDKDGNDTRESAYYMASNRNKRSVTIDIANPEGVRLVKELLKHCDALCHNFKVGGLDKYGLGYEDIHAEFPDKVYLHISGFGRTGPYAKRAGYDMLAQGMGGVMSLTGPVDGDPHKVGVGISDVMCGMYATVGILAALRHKERTGEGQHIDIALVDSQLAWLINEGTNYLESGDLPQRRGNGHPNIVPYHVFAVADGHAIIAVGNDSQFARFCDFLGCADIVTDARFATNLARTQNRDALLAVIGPRLAARPLAAVIAGLEARKVPVGPVNTIDLALGSDQAQARDMVVAMPRADVQKGQVRLLGNPLKLSRTPVTYRLPPPHCGQDSQEILAQLSLDD